MKQLIRYRRNADDLRWQIQLSTAPEFLPPLNSNRSFSPANGITHFVVSGGENSFGNCLAIGFGDCCAAGRRSLDSRKLEKKLLFDYRQLASSTIAPWSPMKKGSSGCVRAMVRSNA